MVQLTQKMQKSEKNAKNALTSHYVNGHGHPCDKWVKIHTTVTTGHQVNFLKGLGFFHNCQHVWGLWKNPKPFKKITRWPVEASKYWCNFFRISVLFFFIKLGKIQKNKNEAGTLYCLL